MPTDKVNVASDVAVKKGGCPNMGGVKYQQWEVVYHRDEHGNVVAEHSAGIDPITRGRAEMRAHQRTRIERVRARLLKRLAKAGDA